MSNAIVAIFVQAILLIIGWRLRCEVTASLAKIFAWRSTRGLVATLPIWRTNFTVGFKVQLALVAVPR